MEEDTSNSVNLQNDSKSKLFSNKNQKLEINNDKSKQTSIDH